MNELQGEGSTVQGSLGSELQSPGTLEQSQSDSVQHDVLGISTVLTPTSSSSSVTIDNSSTGTTSTSAATPLDSSGFSVSPWLMILLGAFVIIGGITFIWSQRHDMQRI